MNSPLQALIQLGVIPTVNFPTNSRYYGSGTLTYMTPTGETITYLARRIVPQPGPPSFATIAQHIVRQGDRLDLIGAIDPNDLVATAGPLPNILNITTPLGVPGAPNAR